MFAELLTKSPYIFSPSFYKMVVDERWLKLHILSMPVWSFSATDLELILFFVIFVVELFCQDHRSIKTACKAL